ncbi:hypothetical protein ACFV9D_13585 [Streptomyces sp. NPDC059875]|uniref:hypothetical protein n=1 Tax=unclassified Streptomyces TaxID=2593676 RepID=UPI0036464613
MTSACARPPDDAELRAAATADGTRQIRESKERGVRELLARLAEVEGLRPGYTVFQDVCAGAPDGNLLEPATGPLMTCSMSLTAVFGVEGDVTEVLRRIDAARVVRWQPNVNGPGSASGGTLQNALEYHRQRGVFPDGRLMPAPHLESEDGTVTITWDHPTLPGHPPASSRVGSHGRAGGGRRTAPTCPPESPVYSRCRIDPERPQSVPAIRARYGTVLEVEIDPDGQLGYFEVPRPR